MAAINVRIIDLHCYPNTKEWIACQQPYVDALAQCTGAAAGYEKTRMLQGLPSASVEAVLVAARPRAAVYRAAARRLRARRPARRLEPVVARSIDLHSDEDAIREAKHAIEDLGMMGFHFHPIMGHYAVNDRALYPLFETIDSTQSAAQPIDVGATGMGAGMPGGMGYTPIPPRSTSWQPIFRT